MSNFTIEGYPIGVNIKDLKPGTQIIYIPDHVHSIHSLQAEDGFVTSVRENRGRDVAFCRYWHRLKPLQLRTTANSECTPVDRLIILPTRSQAEIDAWVEKFKEVT